MAVTITEILTASGTWIAPSDVTSVNVECTASGAGGGERTTTGVGGGGGGGEYAKEGTLAVTGGNPYTVTVGASAATDTNGGSSTFVGDSVTVHAFGGTAPALNSATGGAGGTGSGNTFHHNGGAGGTGSTDGGGGGGSGGSAAAGNAGSGTTGAGGTAVTDGGPGGAGATVGNTNGSAPTSGPGGGGGGGNRSSSGTRAGGASAAGQVKITYTTSTPRVIKSYPATIAASTISGTVSTGGDSIPANNSLLLVASVFWNAPTSIGLGTATSTGDTWDRNGTTQSAASELGFQAFVSNITSPGARTVTLTLPDSSTFGVELQLLHVAGTIIFDDAAGTAVVGTATTTWVAPANTPAGVGELFVSMAGGSSGTKNGGTPSTGFTGVVAAFTANPIAWMVAGAADSTAHGCTWSGSGSDTYSSATFAFKKSSSTVDGTLTGAFGGLTGTLTGKRVVYGSMSGSFGGLTGTLAGRDRVDGTLAGSFGGLTGTLAGKRVVHGTMTGSFGGLTGTLAGVATTAVTGTLTGSFGGLSGTLAGRARADGTLAGSFGGLTGTLAGKRRVKGTLAGSFGGLSGTLTGNRVVRGSMSGAFGGLTGTLAGTVVRPLTRSAGTDMALGWSGLGGFALRGGAAPTVRPIIVVPPTVAPGVTAGIGAVICGGLDAPLVSEPTGPALAALIGPVGRITWGADIYESDGTTLYLGNVALTDGAVTLDNTRDERRMCDVTFSNDDGRLAFDTDHFWYDKIIKLYRGVTWPGGAWGCQVGEFQIDKIQENPAPTSTLHVTGRDYTKKLLLSKLVADTSFPEGTAIEDIVTALAINAGVDPARMQVPVTGISLAADYLMSADTTRKKAIDDLVNAYGYEIFFDATGRFIMRVFQDPALTPQVWVFQTGAGVGNLISWTKSTDDSNLFNHQVVEVTSSSNTVPVWAEAINDDPGSPTSRARVGDRVFRTSTQLPLTADQALAMAQQLLSVSSLEDYEIDMSSLVFPHLDVATVVRFIDPFTDAGQPTQFLLTSIDIPLKLGTSSPVAKRVALVA